LKPQALFFDFDGVILESADVKTDAFVTLFSDYPQHVDVIKEYHLSHMGISRFKKFEWIYREILKREITPQELERLGNAFSSIVFEKVISAPYVPGVNDLLEWSKANCLNFVASGTPEDELNDIVDKRELRHYFAEVCGSPRSKSEIVRTLLKKYDLDPKRCWFIGDANTDHIAALETGLNFVGRATAAMQWYWSSVQDVWLVESLDEIPDRFAAC
jgi:phosphoglycolate phosphatase-like HAD superfamily hydrolase